MKQIDECPPKTLQAGDSLCGFRVLRVVEMPEIRVTAYDVEHERTGAKLLHLHSTESENLFSVGFRTPPGDSTGVPHILEHSVLAGSEAYPVKDAFNELLKGTLQTFINAFTYPDKTVYPVASCVKTDFFNLAWVYCDLVFKPRLQKETFLQEGHHLEFEDPENPESALTVSGIVFNEMKGVYSSPDSLMYRYLQQHLYPETPYAHDSGGDPRVIPSLTYEQLKAFHHSYYSASNARFFLYGDISTREHLEFLEQILRTHDRITVDSRIVSQPRIEQPISIQGYFPAAKEQSLQGKTALNVAWMLADNTDAETVLILTVLSEALVGNAAGPLRKALIDSGLGEDLSPVTGLDIDLKQVMFAVGLRGSEPDRKDKVLQVIMETLQRLAQEGIDRQILEGALHQIEFSGKEIVRGSMPYGIALMQRAYTAWLYDGDPLIVLNFPRGIAVLRERWELNPALFQEAVQKWLVDNPHRVISVVEPSHTLADEQEKAFRAEMSELQSTLSPEDQRRIRAEAEHLRRIQVEPDPPEALATLPELKRSDLSRKIETIPAETMTLEGMPVSKHEIYTNGIAYLDLAFDVSDVPEEYQAYLPILGKLLTAMGAAGCSYEEMTKRSALKTGGIGCYPSVGMQIDGSGHWQKMVFSMRALYRHVPDAIQIARDFLFDADFSDRARMRDLILESKNRLHSAVIPSGHLFAKRTAAAALNISAYRDEQWWGRTQLKLLTDLSERFDVEGDVLLEKIMHLQKEIFQKKRLFINMTADREGLSLLCEEAFRMVSTLPSSEKIGQVQKPPLTPVHTGVSIPAQVCYVAKVLPAAHYLDAISAPLLVLSRLLSNNYLYNRIRVQGGAYGGMSQYEPGTGLFSFLSYRDPNLIETLKVYEEAATYIGQGAMDKRDLEKAVIGTIGQLDRPMDPVTKGYTAMVRSFSGLTDDMRQTYRNRILDTSVDDVVEAARRYLAQSPEAAAIAVFASQERLKEANQALVNKLAIEVLP